METTTPDVTQQNQQQGGTSAGAATHKGAGRPRKVNAVASEPEPKPAEDPAQPADSMGRLTCTLPPETYAKLAKDAADQLRTPANFASWLIHQMYVEDEQRRLRQHQEEMALKKLLGAFNFSPLLAPHRSEREVQKASPPEEQPTAASPPSP